MIPLTLILRKSTAGYDLAKEFKVNHLLFRDDLKLFGKSEDQIDSLGTLSKELMKRGRKVRFHGITLLDGLIIREIEEDRYKYMTVPSDRKSRRKEKQVQRPRTRNRENVAYMYENVVLGTLGTVKKELVENNNKVSERAPVTEIEKICVLGSA